jgi:hypothetical protein
VWLVRDAVSEQRRGCERYGSQMDTHKAQPNGGPYPACFMFYPTLFGLPLYSLIPSLHVASVCAENALVFEPFLSASLSLYLDPFKVRQSQPQHHRPVLLHLILIRLHSHRRKKHNVIVAFRQEQSLTLDASFPPCAVFSPLRLSPF